MQAILDLISDMPLWSLLSFILTLFFLILILSLVGLLISRQKRMDMLLKKVQTELIQARREQEAILSAQDKTAGQVAALSSRPISKSHDKAEIKGVEEVENKEEEGKEGLHSQVLILDSDIPPTSRPETTLKKEGDGRDREERPAPEKIVPQGEVFSKNEEIAAQQRALEEEWQRHQASYREKVKKI